MQQKSQRDSAVVAIATSALVIVGAALSIRYGMLENGLLPRDCTAAGAPAGPCAFKWALVQSFLHQRLGWASLMLGVLAFGFACRRLAWAGWAAGLLGLVFYSFDPAAVGALLSLLVLARPRGERGQGEGEGGEQPGDGLRVGGLR